MSSPGWRRRAVHGLLAAALGGVIGYGIAASGPGPSPSLRAPLPLALTAGLAVACGALGALFPGTVWRRSRWLRHHPERHDR